MKPETAMRHVVMGILREAGLDPCAIESSTGPGIPDINYREGWLELKRVTTLPKRAMTPVRVGLSPQQTAWLLRRLDAGGKASVLVRAEDQWLLFTRPTQIQFINNLSLSGMRGMATALWNSTPHDLARYL